LKITADLQLLFDPGVRSRGELYAIEGKVDIVEGGTRAVTADVHGTSRYRVRIFWSGRGLKIGCTCPHFADEGTPCKHLWATLLVAEEKRFLSAVPEGGQWTGNRSRPERNLEDRGPEDGRPKSGDDGEEEDIERREAPASPAPLPEAPLPEWALRFRRLEDSIRRGDLRRQSQVRRNPSRISYILDVEETKQGWGVTVETWEQRPDQDGEWGERRPHFIERGRFDRYAPDDQVLHTILVDLPAFHSWAHGGMMSRFRMPHSLNGGLLPMLAATGRLLVRRSRDAEPESVEADDGPPWKFRLRMARDDHGKEWVLGGSFFRGTESMDLDEPVLVLATGFIFARGRMARLDPGRSFEWIAGLREEGPIRAPETEGLAFVERALSLPDSPDADLPEELRFEEVRMAPARRILIRAGENEGQVRTRLRAEVNFIYGDRAVRMSDRGCRVVDAARRRAIIRDDRVEREAIDRLFALGFRIPRSRNYGLPPEEGPDLELAPGKLSKAVAALSIEGWTVEAEGKLYRSAGGVRLSVSSGIDWFDLAGAVDFGGKEVPLPVLLAALRRGERTVVLDDGTIGMLPEEWLEKYGFLASMGEVDGDALRFRRTQALLLDALLREQEGVTWDEAYEKARRELGGFEGIRPVDPPASFAGVLRPYQKDGLGWLGFLRRFGFGGCLADDMGLGKTVEVLAHLDAIRAERKRGAGKSRRPSIAVVPRSLVFNWLSEAARFAPRLKVLEHHGTGRNREADAFDGHDLVITTYGILLRDIEWLKDVEFDCAILDESQAVKNANALTAKAVRLLRAGQRIAMSGTPIENHLGELWSLFEFLNPGMLGSGRIWKSAANGRSVEGEARGLLARAIRPFILRRTKGQVAKDLPERTEQTILCDLDAEERKLYDELRDHYRAALLGGTGAVGDGAGGDGALPGSKILVLEALLRLRQAACHPGLIDKKRAGEESTKVELLLDHLTEVTEEGHKALVFSQFTTLLGIVKDRLDERGVAYEYLDGKTRDRQAKVERFQSDPGCKVFLISLKAGGLGLNLTAAEYVFLLDPWWNPAVEAQAIDRAHRIGQTRQVMAFRLIARDTVEEKVLELQREKRALADAIIAADNSLIRDLTREDLERLLS
jgi:hypothetical protein